MQDSWFKRKRFSAVIWQGAMVALTAATSGAFAQTESTRAAPVKSSFAESEITDEQMRSCLQSSVLTADKSMTIKRLEEACRLLLSQDDASTPLFSSLPAKPGDQQDTTQNPPANNKVETHDSNAPSVSSVDVPPKNAEGNTGTQLLKDRLTIEALNRSSRFTLLPHKRNYLMPVSYTNYPNSNPYRPLPENGDTETNATFTDLNHTESELQLSVKILLRENIFDNNGHLYLGYTNHALWQVYNRKISAPFRESDHQPELILSFTNDWEIFGFHNILNEAVLNHQSNGQSGLLSRSWNRIMLNSVFEKDNFVFQISPWYRIPEQKAEYPGDPGGDDNPDITHYMGRFQFTGAYKFNTTIFSLELRNNLESENRGAVELGWTFPVTSTMRGYVNYFDGYGHSLIDYNVKQQVVGLGIIFTDLF